MPPLRTSIARYNTLLLHGLIERGEDVRSYSFSRQYPSWMYPGVSQHHPIEATSATISTVFLIDSLNPLTWLATVRAIRREVPRVVVFHWWTLFWAPAFRVMIWMLKRHGIKVIMICHNLADHDRGPLAHWLARQVWQHADAFLVHASESVASLKAACPGKRVTHHPIPTYTDYPVALKQLPKRGRLELLFFGFIRPYKGLKTLIEAIDRLQDPEVYLTIAGEAWGDQHTTLHEAAKRPRVTIVPRYISDAEAAELFDRADAVVLPYLSATGSGVVSVAFQYGKPILASHVGGLSDVVIEGQTGWLVPPGDAAALADAMQRIGRAEAESLARSVRAFSNSHGWASLCDELVALLA